MPKPKDKVSTQNPYSAAMPAIDDIIGQAGNVYNSQNRANAPLNTITKNALAQTNKLAGQPIHGLDEANQYNTGLLANGGWTDELRGAASGIQANMDLSQQYLTPFMTGQYQEDPRLKAVMERERNDAMNAAFTKYSGRVGAAGFGTGMGNAASAATDSLMLQSNENARNRQLQSIGMNSGIQMQGGGILGGFAEGARGSALQAGSMIPMLDNAKYAGVERKAGVGDYHQNRRQAEHDFPWQNLNNYAGIIGNMGGMGKTTTTPGASGAQSAIGGAFVGGGLGSELGKAFPSIGGWGTAIGGIGGGLLGLMG